MRQAREQPDRKETDAAGGETRAGGRGGGGAREQTNMRLVLHPPALLIALYLILAGQGRFRLLKGGQTDTLNECSLNHV